MCNSHFLVLACRLLQMESEEARHTSQNEGRPSSAVAHVVMSC